MCIRDRAYILYREKRSALRRVRHTIARTVGDDSLDEVLRRIQMDFTCLLYTSVSQLISEAFKYSHIVLASVTYNLGIYPAMHGSGARRYSTSLTSAHTSYMP